MPVAAVVSGLVFQRRDVLEVWDPSTARVIRTLRGRLPVAAHADQLAWCSAPCDLLHVTNVATGRDVRIRLPSGADGFDPYRGVFSPDGTTVAVPVRMNARGANAPRSLALADVSAAAAVTVASTSTDAPHAYVDWSPSGDAVFMCAEDRSGAAVVFEYRIDAGVRRMRTIDVGDFDGMAAL